MAAGEVTASGQGSERKERLSEIIQREAAAEEQGATGMRKTRSRALFRKISQHFHKLHGKMCLECQTQQCQLEKREAPKVVFRVVQPVKVRRSKSGTRKEEEHTGTSIRLATMNVALFSLAPAVPGRFSYSRSCSGTECLSPAAFGPRLASLFLEEPLSPPFSNATSNAPPSQQQRCKLNPAFSPNPFYSYHSSPCLDFGSQAKNSRHSVLEVLRDAKADVIALQEVKADEEKGMAPLSDLAEALGMHYAYADSWAPEFGNAVLSRWPIKNSTTKRIHDNSDCRNLLKVVMDVPSFGELVFCCTHLDHLDEDWRLKQVTSILEDAKLQPHILAGDLNSLRKSDYSKKRWADITKARAECRKVPPRGDVMNRLLDESNYTDACTAAPEELEVVLPMGQDVQGTCKYGTRIDYILASPHMSVFHEFVPGSYRIWSSRGTSDHHLVTADIRRAQAR